MMNKRIKIVVIVTGVILLIPFITMQFSEEVNWSIFDFVIAALLLLGTGFLIDLALRKTTNIKYKTLWIMAIILLLLLVWAELAVGVFDSFFGGN